MIGSVEIAINEIDFCLALFFKECAHLRQLLSD